MPTGIVAVPARIVLLLLLPLPALGEPGPIPHEYRLDRNGHPLPTGAIARLGVPPPLSGFAWTLGWTADGSRFVVVDYAGVTVFDAATGRWVESQAIGTEGRSLYTPLSRDGRLLFLLNGRTGALYDTATADIRTFTLPAPFGDPDRKVYSLTLSANCRFLAGIAAPTSSPGVAWRYDLAHDRFARILTDRADLHSVRLSPDGRGIYATGGTAEPELTARAAGGKELWTTRLKAVGTLRSISADGRRLVVSDNNGLIVFDSAEGKPLLTIPVDSSTPPGLWGIDLSPDGNRLALALDRDVAIWDVANGQVKHRLPHAARMVAFSPDGQALLTVSAWVQRWDVATGKPVYATPMLDKPGPPSFIRWSGDGQRLLTMWPGDRRSEEREWKPDLLAVWDVSRMEVVWRRTSMPTVIEAHLERNGSTVRAVTGDGKLRAWPTTLPDTEDVWPIAEVAGGLVGRRLHTFLADGRLAIQTHASTHAEIDLYDAVGKRTHGPAHRWPEDDRWQSAVHSGLGTTLIGPTGHRGDLAIGRAIPPLDTHAGQFVLKGQPIAGGSALVACRIQISGPWGGPAVEGVVWDSISGAQVIRLMDRIPDWALASLSADGRWLARVVGDAVEVTDLSVPANPWHRLPAPETKALSFAPNGASLATAHADGTVLIWKMPVSAQSTWKAADVAAHWASLGAVDAAEAWRSMWHLLDHPGPATEFLRDRLKPIEALTDTLDQIARLDHPKYAVRELAARELAGRGTVIEGDLRAVWEKTTSPEQRERLEQLLNKLDPSVPPPGEVLRGLRAVWLLERIGTAEAKRLLTVMTGGASGSRVTLEAKAALGRIR